MGRALSVLRMCSSIEASKMPSASTVAMFPSGDVRRLSRSSTVFVHHLTSLEESVSQSYAQLVHHSYDWLVHQSYYWLGGSGEGNYIG